MNRSYKLLLGSIVLLTCGCAAVNPVMGYKEDIKPLENNALKTYKEALVFSTHKVLKLSTKVVFTLTQANKIINIDSPATYYEIFEFEAIKDESYEVDIDSFHRGNAYSGMYIVIPELFYYESQIAAAKINPFYTAGEIPAFGAYRFTQKWKIKAHATGKQFILISANTRHLGERADSTIMPATVAVPSTTMSAGTFHYNFFYDYTGKLDIEVKKL